MEEEFSSLAELEHEVESEGSLEGVVHLDHEGFFVQTLQDLPLRLGMNLLVLLLDHLLRQHLDGVQLVCLLVHHQHHLPE